MPLPVYIMSGGESRRMGSDKALIEINGQPVIAWLAQACLSEGREVFILGPHKVDGCTTIPDKTTYQGPGSALGDICDFPEKAFCNFLRSV